MNSVSIIMPTYNEAGNIEDLILQSVSAVKSFGISQSKILNLHS